jgi:hypothetical protein
MNLTEKQDIIDHLLDYINEQGGNPVIWHIGLCEEPYGLTLNIVKRTSHFWMYIETGSNHIAKEVVDYCKNKVGLISDCNNNNENSIGKVIYIYTKSNNQPT